MSGYREANEGSSRTKMRHTATKVARAGACVCACGLLTLLGTGCGISSLTSGLGGGIFGSSSSQTSPPPGVSEEQLLSAAKSDVGGGAPVGEVAHGCPRLTISPHGGHLTIYENGRAGDGLAIMHRGEITKTARECQIEPGRVTVRYGFSGRVLLGPRGNAGTVRLPINVAVTDAKRAKVTGDTVSVDATVAVDNPIAYFSTVRTITFDIPEGTRPGEFEVFVGFDQNAQGAG